MAIQECYYFSGVGVHWGSAHFFFQIIFSLSHLSLVLTIDFCYSQLIFLKKINSLKEGEGVPLLNFKEGPGVPLLKF